MIKKIIFDVDNTLIKWEKEYWSQPMEKLLREYGYNNDIDTINNMRKALDVYEEENFSKPYNRIDIIAQFNKYMGFNLDIEFIQRWLELLGECAPIKIEETEQTLKYLSNKYNLVVLTNWLSYSQEKRLQKANIMKYFSAIYSTENIPRKPNPKAFEAAINTMEKQNCIMIGDSFVEDIQGALDFGINAIWLDNKRKTEERLILDNKNRKITVIHSLKELEVLL